MQKINYFENEINYIMNNKFKEDLIYLIEKLPNYFFEIEASSTLKHHPKYAVTEKGLLKHTKVATKIAKVLLDNETTGNKFSNQEKDLIIMALILHDGLKRGNPENQYTAFNHPLLISKFITENEKNLNMTEVEIKLLCNIIESHMGQWNIDPYTKKEILPKPSNELGKFVHMCDYLASRKFLNVEFDNNINIIE